MVGVIMVMKLSSTQHGVSPSVSPGCVRRWLSRRRSSDLWSAVSCSCRRASAWSPPPSTSMRSSAPSSGKPSSYTTSKHNVCHTKCQQLTYRHVGIIIITIWIEKNKFSSLSAFIRRQRFCYLLASPRSLHIWKKYLLQH